MKTLWNHVIRDHIFLGALVSLSMLPFYGWAGCGLFFLASILIDLDHYAHFLWVTRFRFWGPARMFHFFEEHFRLRDRPEFLSLEPLHTVEVFGLLALGAFLGGGLLWPVFAGFLFHALVDIAHLIRHKILTRRCHSLIEFVWRCRKLRQRGLDPALIDQEAKAAAGFSVSGPGRSMR